MFAYQVIYQCNHCGILTDALGGRSGLDQPSADRMLPEGWHRPLQSHRAQANAGGPHLCPRCAPIGLAWDQQVFAWQAAKRAARSALLKASVAHPPCWPVGLPEGTLCCPAGWQAIKADAEAWEREHPPPVRPELKHGWGANWWRP